MATDNKYDRQERLWGKTGQAQLRQSRVLLLGCATAGIECLKNLVLPACGFVALVDAREVRQEDLESNFFVNAEDIGKKIAYVSTKHLLEMNEDVQGIGIAQDPALLAQDTAFLAQFNLVVANELPENILKVLSTNCGQNTKLVILNTAGFFGSVRLQTGTHYIVNSQRAGSFLRLNDLRLRSVFPSLKALIDSYNLTELAQLVQQYYANKRAAEEAAHNNRDFVYPPNYQQALTAYEQYKSVPYPVIVAKANEEWLRTHNNTYPKTPAEKRDFKKIIETWGDSLALNDRDNFKQAHQFSSEEALTRDAGYQPENIKKLFASPLSDVSNTSSSLNDFWIIIRALKLFVQNNNSELPVSYSDFPDMVSTTQTYLALRQCYVQKHEEDLQKIQELIQKEVAPGRRVSSQLLQEIIQRFHSIDFVHTQSYVQELDAQPPAAKQPSNAVWNVYYALRAGARFRTTEGRTPTENDAQKIAEIASQLANSQQALDTRYTAELARYGDAKYHPVSALLGSVAAQEALKLITNQFVPVQNTFIYDGLTGDTAQILA